MGRRGQPHCSFQELPRPFRWPCPPADAEGGQGECADTSPSLAVAVASGKAAPSVDSVTKGGRPLPEQRHFDPVTENRESRCSPAFTHGPAAGRAFDVLGLSTHRVTISQTPSG